MPSRLVPLATDPEAGLRLGVAAATARTDGGAQPSPWVRVVEQQLRAGTVNGRLYLVDGVPKGFVSWSDAGPLGVTVDLLYAVPGARTADDYAAILAALEAVSGTPAFVPAPFAGVPPEAEERLMRARGYRHYGRSEMLWTAGVPVAPAVAVAGESIRPVRRDDVASLAELHRRAYRDRFDRYLFMESEDDVADALREVRQILEGRWGAFVPAASRLLEQDGRAVGAVLGVRGPAGVLIADVMVEPTVQGRGVGRRVLLAALRSAEAAGEPRVYLNVTEGNDRAIALYRRVGFVRSLGPTRDWYNARRIPIAPGPDA